MQHTYHLVLTTGNETMTQVRFRRKRQSLPCGFFAHVIDSKVAYYAFIHRSAIVVLAVLASHQLRCTYYLQALSEKWPLQLLRLLVMSSSTPATRAPWWADRTDSSRSLC